MASISTSLAMRSAALDIVKGKKDKGREERQTGQLDNGARPAR